MLADMEVKHLPIESLVKLLTKLPGLGARSARRISLHLLKNKENLLEPLAQQLLQTAKHITFCEICGALDVITPCHYCLDPKRLEKRAICLVEDVADLWAIERSNAFFGHYHVLGGTISALEGRGPDMLNIDSLMKRIESQQYEELIMALNPTVEGQTTAHYVLDQLRDYPIQVSRLAFGIPLGGELDYLDEGTLTMAMETRRMVTT